MNSCHLSAHDIVMINCELYRPSDQVVEELWSSSRKEPGSMQFHGFKGDSVDSVDLKRFLSTISLNYIFVKIQDLMGVSLMDTRHQEGLVGDDKRVGVFLTKDSAHNERRFVLVTRFQIYDTTTCTPTNRRITTTMQIHESPSPWVVACRVDVKTVEDVDVDNITE